MEFEINSIKKNAPGRSDRGYFYEVLVLDCINQLLQLRFGMEADGAAGESAVFAEDQSGNAADAKLGSQARFFIDIYFAELYRGFFLRQFFHEGGEHTAGPAPGRPKIDADGLCRLDDFLFKIFGMQFGYIHIWHFLFYK